MRIRCARRTGRDGARGGAALRGDITDEADIVDMEGAAVAIPTGSVGGVSRPVKGLLRRRYPSPLTVRARARDGLRERLRG